MMPIQNDPLWQSLSAFTFDQPGSALTFSMRLARENGWSHRFALRVVDEYRKFLFLASRAGHPVTPSDEVDQAWHLHLVYTESYWNDLCRDVLGKSLHHGPTKGGLKEGEKFSDWYDRTFASYERFFGHAPPDDVWPPSELRFAPTTFLRVNTDQWWMVSRTGFKQSLKAAAVLTAGGLALAAGLAACSSTGDDTSNMLLIIPIVMLLLILIAASKNRGGKGKGGCGGSSGCSTGGSGCSSSSSSHSGHGHSGCGSHHGGSGCGSHGGGDSGGSSGCGSSCGGGGCGGGGGD
jgi:hypothetical protein